MPAKGSKTAPERISLSAYARRRGITVGAVTDAIKTGRIVKGHGRNKAGAPFIVPDVADLEWAANTDPTATRHTITGTRATNGEAATPAAGAGPSRGINDSKQLSEYYKAEKARIEVEQLLGELVPIADVKATVAAEYTSVRQRLIGIPSKYCAELALLDDPAEVRRVLTAAVEDALNELTADEVAS